VSGATSYLVQVSKDSSYRSVTTSKTQTGTELVFQAKESGDYSWRVAAKDAEGRVGAFAGGRKLHLLSSPPSDQLLEPIPNAVIGQAAGEPLRISFRWNAEAAGRQYRLVISRSQDLEKDRVAVTSQTNQQEVATLKPGTYFWGVYAVQEDESRPLFTHPRALQIKRVAASMLKAPKKVHQWGE